MLTTLLCLAAVAFVVVGDIYYATHIDQVRRG
jgi:hypothetical protein